MIKDKKRYILLKIISFCTVQSYLSLYVIIVHTNKRAAYKIGLEDIIGKYIQNFFQPVQVLSIAM